MILEPIDKSLIRWYVIHEGECVDHAHSYDYASAALGELILKKSDIKPLNGNYFRMKDGNVRMS